jgi:hypothetical protein
VLKISGERRQLGQLFAKNKANLRQIAKTFR